MEVHIQAYGVLRPRVPAGLLELPAESRVADLLACLGLQNGVWMVRVNKSTTAPHDYPLQDGDLVELIPPLSGG